MTPKTKHRLALTSTTSILLFLDAYYLGHGIDGCDSDAQRLPYIIGLILFLVFSGLVISAPLGKKTLQKFMFLLAKIAVILIVLAVAFYLSFTLCF